MTDITSSEAPKPFFHEDNKAFSAKLRRQLNLYLPWVDQMICVWPTEMAEDLKFLWDYRKENFTQSPCLSGEYLHKKQRLIRRSLAATVALLSATTAVLALTFFSGGTVPFVVAACIALPVLFNEVIKAGTKLYNKVKSRPSKDEFSILSPDDIQKMRTAYGLSDKAADWRVRWAAGDSDPRHDWRNGIHAKSSNAEYTGAAVGAVFGGLLGALIMCTDFAFFGSGIPIPVGSIVAAVLAPLLTTFFGAYIGKDIGKTFSKHRGVDAEHTVPGTTSVTHPGRWKAKRMIRYMIIIASYAVLAFFTPLSAAINMIIAYSVAGAFTGGAFKRWRGKPRDPNQTTTHDNQYKNYNAKETWTDEDVKTFKNVCLEYHSEYKTKLEHYTFSSAIADRINHNVETPYILMMRPIDSMKDATVGQKVLKKFCNLACVPIFAVSLVWGLAKSLVDLLLILPVVNKVVQHVKAAVNNTPHPAWSEEWGFAGTSYGKKRLSLYRHLQEAEDNLREINKYEHECATSMLSEEQKQNKRNDIKAKFDAYCQRKVQKEKVSVETFKSNGVFADTYSMQYAKAPHVISPAKKALMIYSPT